MTPSRRPWLLTRLEVDLKRDDGSDQGLTNIEMREKKERETHHQRDKVFANRKKGSTYPQHSKTT
jgi:hypothetical protein